MFARVMKGQFQPDQLDTLSRMIHDQVVPRVRELQGFKGGYWLMDRSSGHVMGVTLFKDEASLRASEAQANRIREEGARSAGLPIPTFETYEVFESTGSATELAA